MVVSNSQSILQDLATEHIKSRIHRSYKHPISLTGSASYYINTVGQL